MEKLTHDESRRLNRVINCCKDYTETCLTEKPSNLYRFSRNFFHRQAARSSCKSSILRNFQPDSMMSLLGDTNFRHRTVYNRTDSSVLATNATIVYPKTPQQKEYLTNLCKGIFKEFEDKSIESTVDSFLMKDVKKGDLIIDYNDDVTFFYIVQEGVFHSYVTSPVTGVTALKDIFLAGSWFGQSACLYSTIANYTIKAVTDGILWALEGKTYKEIEFRNMYHARQKFNKIINNVDILKDLPKEDQDKLVDAFVIKIYDEDDIIFREDQDPDGMYFIEKGEVTFSYYDDEEMNYIKIARLGPGNYFGEMTLLNADEKNIFRVSTPIQSILAFLNKDAFNRLLKNICHAELTANVSRIKYMFKEKMGVELSDAITAKYGQII